MTPPAPPPRDRHGPFRGPLLVAGGVLATLLAAYGVLGALFPPYTACPEGRLPPVFVSGPTPGGGAVSLRLSADGSCAVMADGSVWCWGWEGLPGFLDAPYGGAPHPVRPAGEWAAVSLGEQLRCLVRKDGHAECEGLRVTPQPPLLLEGVRKVVIGSSHHCSIRQDGTLACWGSNGSGQLFDGSTADRATPELAREAKGPVRDVAVGLTFTCALGVDGAVSCRGISSRGKMDPPSDLPPVAELAAGANHACARTVAGAVICWGESVHGELGTTDASARSLVTFPQPAQEIAASGTRTCARLANREVWCWGENGDDAAETEGASRKASRPLLVAQGASRIALSPSHGCLVAKEAGSGAGGKTEKSRFRSICRPIPPASTPIDARRGRRRRRAKATRSSGPKALPEAIQSPR